MGWASKKNGELLRLMASHFDVFVTVDSNLSAQQNLSASSFAVIVLRAHNNRLATLKLLMPQVLTVLRTVQPGEIVFVE